MHSSGLRTSELEQKIKWVPVLDKFAKTYHMILLHGITF